MATEDKEKSMDPTPSTEEPEEEEASVSSWFSSWYDTAKQKLAETNEFMKHDIQEFTQAVQTDASKLVAATATTMKEKLNINVDLEEASAATRVVKDSLSNFLGNIANKVGPQRPTDDENDDETAFVGTAGGTKVMSPSEARIYAIQTDPATFCNEPDSESEFHMWLPDFNLEAKKNEISTLMLDVSQIRAIYTKLVPSAVSHCDFWTRYFFKIHQHEKAEERRALLVERAQKTHDDIGWEDEDDDWVQTEKPKIEKDIVDLPPKPNVTTSPPDEKSCPPENVDAESTEKVEKTECSGKFPSQPPLPDVKSPPKDPESHQKPLDNVAIAEIASASVDTEPSDNVSPEIEEKDKISNENEGNEQCPNKESELLTKKEKAPTSEDKSKSTQESSDKTPPTTAAKTPSSEESSDDWEKDFDLDMTEDEIQQALKESEQLDDEDIEDDWENWE